jgi:hypothetical protein
MSKGNSILEVGSTPELGDCCHTDRHINVFLFMQSC